MQHIDLGAYLDDLLPSVFSFYPGKPVHIINRVCKIQLSTAVAVLVGVLVNELAMNVMKHGFDSSSNPSFTVSSRILEHSDGDRRTHIVLTVSNNGRSFPADIDLETATSLGLQLITALTGQLQGTIELTRVPETTFTITFPI